MVWRICHWHGDFTTRQIKQAARFWLRQSTSQSVGQVQTHLYMVKSSLVMHEIINLPAAVCQMDYECSRLGTCPICKEL